MGLSSEEIFQIFSNLAGATAGSASTAARAESANKGTQSNLNRKYQKDLEEEKKKQEKAGIFGSLGSALGGVAGQALIPIPGVGAAIGSAVGGAAGSAAGGGNNPLEYGGVAGANTFVNAGAKELAGNMSQNPDIPGATDPGVADPNYNPVVSTTHLTDPGLGNTKNAPITSGNMDNNSAALLGPSSILAATNEQQYNKDLMDSFGVVGTMLMNGMAGQQTKSYMGSDGLVRKADLFNPPSPDIPVYDPTTGLIQHATGTPLLQQDEVAQLHQGEAVIPAPANPMNPGGNPVAQMLVGAGLNMGANMVDPTKGIGGKPNPNPVQQSLEGANPHAIEKNMQQSVENTGMGTRFQNMAGMPGDAMPLTPEAQAKVDAANKIRGINPQMLMSVMQMIGGMINGNA